MKEEQAMVLELEKQITSLELSRELRELGVKQDSIYYWVQGGGYPDDWGKSTLESERQIKNYDKDFVCSAFTVAEHGEALPGEISILGTKYYLNMGKIDSQKIFYVRYTNQDIYDTVRKVNSKTEADARAKMRIILIKDKLIEVNEK